MATAVALYSAWMLLSTALTAGALGYLLILFSDASVEVAIVIASTLLALAALLLVPWMRRVLRGGPIAFLLFQAFSVPPNVQPLVAILTLLMAAWVGESGVGLVLAALGGVNTLVLVAVLPFVLGKLLFHQDVRAWLDSRNRRDGFRAVERISRIGPVQRSRSVGHLGRLSSLWVAAS